MHLGHRKISTQLLLMQKNNITPANTWIDEFYASSIKKLRKNCQTTPHILNVVEALTVAEIAFCVTGNRIHPKMQATLSTTGLLLFILR